MNILILSPNYPTEKRDLFPFVKQLVDEWARQGHKCWVLCPFSITREKSFHKQKEIISSSNHGSVTILRPNYFTLSRYLLKFGQWQERKAFKRGLKWLPDNIDVVYGHFWDRFPTAYPYALGKNIPLFIGSGESEIMRLYKTYDQDKENLKYVKGVICVSTKNKDESVSLNLTKPDKCIVVPNAVDNNLFRKLDRVECRARLGLPQDIFIVAFVGWFNERKGSKRVADAIKRIKENNVFSVFIGTGNEDPQCPNILFKGRLLHEEIPIYLNAADVFVLPTLHEGCCNAVVEAMACGLPVISSNRSFNWDVLDDSNSIMIDPESIDEIASAIVTLRDNVKMREDLASGSIEKAKSLTIEKRAKTIIDFMLSKI